MGGQSWRAKILLINIHYSSILLPKRALNRVLRAMLVPSRMLYAYKRKFLQCETTRTVKRSITGVATNNYSMNFNYLATRGGELAPDSPLDPPCTDNVYSTVPSYAVLFSQQCSASPLAVWLVSIELYWLCRYA